MSVRSHQVAAVSTWTVGLVVVLVWGQSMTVESGEIRDDRGKLQGSWVATRIEVGENSMIEGPEAEKCGVRFDGKTVVFHDLVDAQSAAGTAYLERKGTANLVDFRLDVGWIIGLYEVEGETLKLAINALAPPEKLGVPTRPRPRAVKGGPGHHYYEFRKVAGRVSSGS